MVKNMHLNLTAESALQKTSREAPSWEICFQNAAVQIVKIINWGFVWFLYIYYEYTTVLTTKFKHIAPSTAKLQTSLKEKLPQAIMHIEWMENDFRNPTAKF